MSYKQLTYNSRLFTSIYLNKKSFKLSSIMNCVEKAKQKAAFRAVDENVLVCIEFNSNNYYN